eukprot:6041170-Lingulodinium_polyedra.AAC.1
MARPLNVLGAERAPAVVLLVNLRNRRTAFPTHLPGCTQARRGQRGWHRPRLRWAQRRRTT